MKIVSIASARPNFVKLASVHHAFEKLKGKDDTHVIIHTGQHYDALLSDVFFKQLAISEPKYNLGVKGSQDRDAMVAATTEALIPVLQKEKPDVVVVYGDVNGALGAARAAKKLNLKLAHVEAGLRSFDMDMPEEHNRIGVDELADFLFVTEQAGVDNLKKEKRTGEIHLVGNTMIDTLLRNKKLIDRLGEKILQDLPKLRSGKFAIATIHRPSNVDDPKTLKRVMDFLKEVAAHCSISLPPHPRLKLALENMAFSLKDDDVPLYVLDAPMDYFMFMGFMSQSAFIITDSGGIQEEAVILGKKCFTLRRNTERPSTIESGSNELIDQDNPADRKRVLDFAKNPVTPKITVLPIWDGKAGERIVEILRSATK